MIKITLPDGNIKSFEKKITPLEIAKSISEGLARNVISALVDNNQVEVTSEITADCKIQLLTWNDTLGKAAFWHSSAHLMAQSILFYFPNANLTIGPSIENGFYYDVDFGDQKIVSSDFEKIEQKMLENARKKSTFNLYPIQKNEALNYFKNNPYKVELITNLEDGSITFCKHDDFTDLCRGGHIPDTSHIKAVKLLSIAGAYWRGNEKNAQLTRIYGISFPKQKELADYLIHLEEVKKRDHRKLGKEMGIFTFSEKVGSGLPLWLPNGAALKRKLENFLIKKQEEAGYQLVSTPHIGNKDLYVTSGHYEKYGEDSFQPIHTPSEGEEFLLKPMNCPHHCEIFNHAPISYKDLPLRLAEFGTVYRYEQSGELSGLTRVRGFTQDDAHIFCTSDQLLEEFKSVIDLVLYVFRTLGFNDFTAQISLRDKENKSKYIGSDENWEKAENAIVAASKEKNLTTTVEYGEAAFYGPKLDFMVKDVLGRKWQLGTIQVDYNLPERFNLYYTGSDNQKHRPVMIHRAPFGSLERFIAILLEHTSGNLPIWLTTNQVVILPISENHKKYAEKVLKLLKKSDICGFVDSRNEKTGKKIRDAEISKVPYIIVVGDEEENNNNISIRKHGGQDLGSLTTESFALLIKKEINEILKTE